MSQIRALSRNNSRLLPWTSARLNVINRAYKFKTLVKQSRINESQYGRFAEQDIPYGSTIFKREMIEIGNCKDNEIFSNDKAILMKNKKDLYSLANKYISNCQLAEDSESIIMQDVLSGFERFLEEYDGNCVLLSQSDFINYVPNHVNMKCYTNNGYLFGIASKDIEKNEQLFIDYSKFQYPSYYFEFCKENNMMPMPQMVDYVIEQYNKKIESEIEQFNKHRYANC